MASVTRADYPSVTGWIETEGSHYGLTPSGIIVSVVKPVHYTEANARADFEALKEHFYKSGPTPALIDGRAILGMDRAARIYWADDPEVNRLGPAVALIVDSALSRMVFNVYIRIARPNRPHKMFSYGDEAEAWLLKFKPTDAS